MRPFRGPRLALLPTRISSVVDPCAEPTDEKAGNVALGTTFVHEADFVLELTLTALPDPGDIYVAFRRQDANNYWRLGLERDRDIQLAEFVSGSGVARASASNVTANGDHIVVRCSGSTITIWSGAAGAEVQRINYTLASNFQLATAGLVQALGTNGVISDLTTWPVSCLDEVL